MATSNYAELRVGSSLLQVVEPERRHLEELAFAMRNSDRLEISRSNPDESTHAVVKASVEMSAYRRAALINGRVAAVWGLVLPSLLSEEGFPWGLTTPVVDKHPLLFLRGSKFYIDEMLRIAPRLVVVVDSEYKSALRWLAWLGFNVDTPIDIRGFPFREARMEVG